MSHSNDEHSQIDISSEDMALLRKVLRLSDDIVLSIFDSRDKGSTLLVSNQSNPVANGHRVSASDTFQSKVTLYLALYELSIVGFDGIPTTSILYY